MEKNLKSSKGRRPYQKPRIEQVELKPEEAVLTACKTTHGQAGPSGKCHQTGGSCAGLGS